MHDKTTATLHFDELTLSYLLDNPIATNVLLEDLREQPRLKMHDKRDFWLYHEQTNVTLSKALGQITVNLHPHLADPKKQATPAICIQFYDPSDTSFPEPENMPFYEAKCSVLSTKELMMAELQKKSITLLSLEQYGYTIFSVKNFQGMPIDEKEDLDILCKKAVFVKQYGILGVAVFSACGDLDHAARYLDENYKGSWDSKGAFAQHFWHEICANLDICTNFSELAVIDEQRFCEEIFQKYFFSVIVRGKVHVFSNNLEHVGTKKPKHGMGRHLALEEPAGMLGMLDKAKALLDDIAIGLRAKITACRKRHKDYDNRLLGFQEMV